MIHSAFFFIIVRVLSVCLFFVFLRISSVCLFFVFLQLICKSLSISVCWKTITITLTSTSVFNSIILFNEIVFIVFFIFVFIQTEHRYVRESQNEIINIVNSIVIINSRSNRVFVTINRDIKTIFTVEFNSYSIEWILSRDSFAAVVRRFHIVTVQYRQTRIYFNFLSITNNSSNNNDNTSRDKNRFDIQQSRFSIIDRKSISIISRKFNFFFISDVSRSDRFDDSKQSSHVRLLIVSSFSFLIENFNNRRVSIKQFSIDIQSIDTRRISILKKKTTKHFSSMLFLSIQSTTNLRQFKRKTYFVTCRIFLFQLTLNQFSEMIYWLWFKFLTMFVNRRLILILKQ